VIAEQREAAIPSRSRIGINAHLLGSGEGYRRAGVSRYISNLLTHLQEADADGDYVLFLAARSTLSLPHDLKSSRLPTDNPGMRILWEQLVLPRAARSENLSLLHSPVNIQPVALPCKGVVTVMDLSFLAYPESFKRPQRFYQTTFTRLSARHATRLIAISLQTARDLIRRFQVPANKITVIYPGVDSRFRPLAEGPELNQFRRKLGLPDRFILCVGTLEPRKNLVMLLRAYNQFKRQTRTDHKLVLAGGKGWLDQPIQRTISELGLDSDVLLPGFVAENELPLWYNSADAFVYPSLYEGFGLPALEAMACGRPVLVANTSSLPEVVGEAGILLNPDSPEVWAEALMRICSDGNLRSDLSSRALARAQLFSWSKMARETVLVYHEALSGGT